RLRALAAICAQLATRHRRLADGYRSPRRQRRGQPGGGGELRARLWRGSPREWTMAGELAIRSAVLRRRARNGLGFVPRPPLESLGWLAVAAPRHPSQPAPRLLDERSATTSRARADRRPTRNSHARRARRATRSGGLLHSDGDDPPHVSTRQHRLPSRTA